MPEHAADRWPRLMRRETAAAYCDMTPDQFDRQCPVGAKDQGWRGLRWDRKRLDEWIDNIPEGAPRRARALDGAHGPPPDEGAPSEPPAMSAAERKAKSLAHF